MKRWPPGPETRPTPEVSLTKAKSLLAEIFIPIWRGLQPKQVQDDYALLSINSDWLEPAVEYVSEKTEAVPNRITLSARLDAEPNLAEELEWKALQYALQQGMTLTPPHMDRIFQELEKISPGNLKLLERDQLRRQQTELNKKLVQLNQRLAETGFRITEQTVGDELDPRKQTRQNLAKILQQMINTNQLLIWQLEEREQNLSSRYPD